MIQLLTTPVKLLKHTNQRTKSVLGSFFLNIFSHSSMKKTDGCRARPTCGEQKHHFYTALEHFYINNSHWLMEIKLTLKILVF